jgi:hypothetical protein
VLRYVVVEDINELLPCGEGCNDTHWLVNSVSMGTAWTSVLFCLAAEAFSRHHDAVVRRYTRPALLASFKEDVMPRRGGNSLCMG